MSGEGKLQRVVASRMRLRERFNDRIAATPAQSDVRPQGSGAPNRHGMPKLPPGQHQTKKWPVLDLGVRPDIAQADWKLTTTGACDNPLALDWQQLMSLPQVQDTSDFHCVTAWSRYDIEWIGVRLADVIELSEPHDTAVALMCHGYDNYTTNVSLVEALKEDVLLAHTADGEPLAQEHGGPVRVITPQLYAWKGTKWVKSLEFLTEDKPGFWEQRGYSSSAHPWREDRYS